MPSTRVAVTATFRWHGPDGGSPNSTSNTTPYGSFSVMGPPPRPASDLCGEHAPSTAGSEGDDAGTSTFHVVPSQTMVLSRRSGPPGLSRPPYNPSCWVGSGY